MKTTHFGSLIALTLLSGFSLSLFGSDKKGQQAKTEISGIITDYFKEAMVGVTVVNRTNNKHTYSDIDGHYIISASPGDTLSFRYIGYMENIVRVENQKNLDITMIIGRCEDSYPNDPDDVYYPTLQLIHKGLSEKPVARYTVLPSWDKPHSLSLEKTEKETYFLLSKTLPDYANRKKDNRHGISLSEKDVATDSLIIDQKLYSAIESLFSETLAKMSKIIPEGLDGVTYYLSATDKDGEVIVRSLWSPDQGSVPDELTQILDRLYMATINRKVPYSLQNDIQQMIIKIRAWDSYPDKIPPQR